MQIHTHAHVAGPSTHTCNPHGGGGIPCSRAGNLAAAADLPCQPLAIHSCSVSLRAASSSRARTPPHCPSSETAPPGAANLSLWVLLAVAGGVTCRSVAASCATIRGVSLGGSASAGDVRTWNAHTDAVVRAVLDK
eukprot:165358-Chlamydomonas_euryale.AAC.2